MSPTALYPKPITIWQNDGSRHGMYDPQLSKEEIHDFFRDYIIANQSQWDYRGSLPINFENDYSMSYIK
jgi:hypothetical protein